MGENPEDPHRVRLVAFETKLAGEVVDYQACYRSEAGTGTANGFVYWN